VTERNWLRFGGVFGGVAEFPNQSGANSKGLMVRPGRFERPTFCSGGKRSIQLSYGRTTPPIVSLTPNPAGFRLGRARIRAEQSITAKQTALRQISHSIFSSQNEPGAKRPAVGPLWFFGR
jgi:hypothetical protein